MAYGNKRMVAQNTLPATGELLNSSLSFTQLLQLSEFYSALYALLMLQEPDPHYPRRSKTQINATVAKISAALPQYRQALQRQRREVEALLRAGEAQQVRQWLEQSQGQIALLLQKRGSEAPAGMQSAIRPAEVPSPAQLPPAIWNALPEEIRVQWAARRAKHPAATEQG